MMTQTRKDRISFRRHRAWRRWKMARKYGNEEQLQQAWFWLCGWDRAYHKAGMTFTNAVSHSQPGAGGVPSQSAPGSDLGVTHEG